MAGASADGEQNPWPAFVDVLTTVIMVVTFLLVIMSAAVMKLSQSVVEEVKQTFSAEAVERTRAELETVKAELKKQVAVNTALSAGGADPRMALRAVPLTQAEASGGDLQRAVQSRVVDEDGKYRADSPKDEPVTGGAIVESADVLLTVTFEKEAVQVSDAVMAESVAKVRSNGVNPTARYEIWSTAPIDTSLSDAQRRAYFRALVVRNILIRAGVPSANITAQVRVVQGRSDSHAVRVVVKP
jgi:hypothetical protein